MQKKQHYSKIELFFRSLFFSMYMIVSIIIFSFICLFSFTLPILKRHAVLRTWLRSTVWMLDKTCHIDYRVEGLENLIGIKNGIAFSKHQSTWETFFLPLIFHDPAVILKRELLWLPFFGWGLLASDPISINRSKKTSAMQQIIKKGKECLDSGRWVLIFPEGTRVPYGKVGHYRLGGARLAAATGYPIVPVAHDAGRYWPKRGFLKKPGTIHVVIGPVIDSVNKTPDEILKLAKNWIETTMAQIHSLVDETTSQ